MASARLQVVWTMSETFIPDHPHQAEGDAKLAKRLATQRSDAAFKVAWLAKHPEDPYPPHFCDRAYHKES